MNKYLLLLICPMACGIEKELPKPIIRPREVIIYPPTTAAEFLERRRVLTEALANPYGTHIIVKNQKPKDEK